MSEQQPDTFARFIGLLLIGVAILWIAFCGLCAFGVMATVMTESPSIGQAAGAGLFVLVIAGLGAAGGYAVLIAGRSLWKSK